MYSFVCDTDPWNCEFDQFFAQFTQIVHTEAVFSVFMYHEDTDTLIGAYRQPDTAPDDGVDSTIIIMSYAGGCRRDRLYNATSRMRTPVYLPDEIPNYSNCDWNPRQREWWTKGQELGVGRAAWTEPYVFSEYHRGMSYVAPSRWKGKVRLLCHTESLSLFPIKVAFSRILESHICSGGDHVHIGYRCIKGNSVITKRCIVDDCYARIQCSGQLK